MKNKLVINFYSDIIIKLYTIKIILKRALLAKHAKPYNNFHHFSFDTACLFSSFVQDSLANLIGLKTTYIFGLAMFGLSMFFTVVFPSVVVLNICAAFSGLGFAVATTIPCSLLTRYHQQPDLFFRDTRPIGAFTGTNL